MGSSKHTKNMKRMNGWVLATALLLSGLTTLTSCNEEDNAIVTPVHDDAVYISCVKPDYLKAGDKVALISPSYFTPMENVEKTADVLRGWGL